MAVYDYNEFIKFDLSPEYQFERGTDRKGKEFVRIMTGKNDEGDYEFYCFVNLFELNLSDFDAARLLKFADKEESINLIKLSDENNIFLEGTTGSYAVFGSFFNTFELKCQTDITEGVVLELTVKTVASGNETLETTKTIERLLNVLSSVRVNGERFHFDSISQHEIETTLLPQKDKTVNDITPKIQLNISINGEENSFELYSHESYNDPLDNIDKCPACGIWLMLGQITALCKNTEFFSDDDIEIINEGITTHELLVSEILERDPVVYESALKSNKAAAACINSIKKDNGEKAILIFKNAKRKSLPLNFDKAFILISLFYDIPYANAISLPYGRKQSIMQDCKGFVNSIRTILSMEGYKVELPRYCKADSISTKSVKQLKPEKDSVGTQRKDSIVANKSKTVETNIGEYTVISSKTPYIFVKGKTLDLCYEKDALEKIIVSDDFKIVNSAFCMCKNLKEVIVSEGITELRQMVFASCPSLEKIVLPNTLESIGKQSFSNCTSLKEIIIPNSVKRIGIEAFVWCKSLREIRIPNSVIEIGSKAFEGCEKLQTIYLPSSISKITGKCRFLPENINFYVEKNSVAEDYVKKNYKNASITYI